MTTPYRSYQDNLIEDLKEPEEASIYLNIALEEGDHEAFLVALKNVTMAQGGVTKVAKEAHLNRVSLQRMLTGKGNPRLNNLSNVLHSLGLRLTIAEAKAKSSHIN